MRIRLAILFLSFWMINPMVIPADEQIPPAPPSGSLSQTSHEGSQKTAPEAKVSSTKAQPLTKEEPSSTATTTDQSVSPADAAGTDTTPKVDGSQPQASPTVQDRRWIIRTPPPESRKARPAPIKPVKWTSDAQKKQCEEYLEKLSSAFLKARYYSIQGDSCACAENAGQFLSVYEKSHLACPDNFLENEGYSDRITRNMGWLRSLGEKRCLGPSTAPGGQSELKTDPPPGNPPESTQKGMHTTPQPTGNQAKPALVTPLEK